MPYKIHPQSQTWPPLSPILLTSTTSVNRTMIIDAQDWGWKVEHIPRWSSRFDSDTWVRDQLEEKMQQQNWKRMWDIWQREHGRRITLRQELKELQKIDREKVERLRQEKIEQAKREREEAEGSQGKAKDGKKGKTGLKRVGQWLQDKGWVEWDV